MQSTTPDPAQIHAIMMAMVPFFFFGMLVVWAILIVPFWQIFKKAGFSPALSLLMILPLVNLVMLYVLAFSRWRVVPAGPEYPPYPAPYPPVPPAGYAPPGYVPPAGYASTPQTPVYPPQPPTNPEM